MSGRGVLYPVAVAGCVIAVATTEWRTDEDMVTLVVLVASGLILGWLQPRLFALSGVLLGLIVPLINLLTLMSGLRPAYETPGQAASHGLVYVISLLILIIPAMAGALLGRLGRTIVVSSRR